MSTLVVVGSKTATKAARPAKRPIHALIKSRRRELRLTQTELGERIGKHKSYVSHCERGVFAPSWRVQPTLAAALGLTVAELNGIA